MAKEKIEKICQIDGKIARNSSHLLRFLQKNPYGKDFHVNPQGCGLVSWMIRSKSW